MARLTGWSAGIFLLLAGSAVAQDVATINGNKYAKDQFKLETAHIPVCAISHHHATNGSSVVDINGQNILSDPGGCGYGLLTFSPLVPDSGGESGSTPLNPGAIDLFLSALFHEVGPEVQSTGPSSTSGLGRSYIPFATPVTVHASSGGRKPDVYSDARVLSRISTKLGGILMGQPASNLERLLDAANKNMGSGRSLTDAIIRAASQNPDEAEMLRNDTDMGNAMQELWLQALEDLEHAGTLPIKVTARQALLSVLVLRVTLDAAGQPEPAGDLPEIEEATRLEELGNELYTEDGLESKFMLELATEMRIEAAESLKNEATLNYEWSEEAFEEANPHVKAADEIDAGFGNPERTALAMEEEARGLELDLEAGVLNPYYAKLAREEAAWLNKEVKEIREKAEVSTGAWNFHMDQASEYWTQGTRLRDQASEAWEKSSDQYAKAADNAEMAGNYEEAAKLYQQAGDMIDPRQPRRPWPSELAEGPDEFVDLAELSTKAAGRYEEAADLQDELGNNNKAGNLRNAAQQMNENAASYYRSAADILEQPTDRLGQPRPMEDRRAARECREAADELDPPPTLRIPGR